MNVEEIKVKFKEIFGSQDCDAKSIDSKCNVKRNRKKEVRKSPVRRSERLKIRHDYRLVMDGDISEKDRNQRSIHKLPERNQSAIHKLPEVVDNKMFKCSQCHSSYTYKNALHKHIQSHHTDILFKCDLCGSLFKRKDSVNRHKAHVHQTQIGSKMMCRFCFKLFQYNPNLIRHIRKFHS